MIWKCPYNYKCSTCSHHHVDKSIGRDYCLKTGKEIKVCRNKLNKDGCDEKSGLRWTVY